MNVAIVTDSTADIPSELAGQLSISVMPNVMVIDGRSLEDGKGISREEFYNRLPELKTPPSTGTASTGKYIALYETLFNHGAEHIISIHASRHLSGIVNAVHGAAQAYPGRVHLVDSETVTLGLGFQAIAAAEASARGAVVEEILALLAGMRKRARVIAMLDTLEYVRRSGRVSWAKARLGNFLQIKPFVEVREGVVQSLGEARTRRKGIQRLQQFLLQQGALECLALLHTNAEVEARSLLDGLNIEVPSEPLVVNITTIVGTHVGPNALGFAAVVK